MNASDKLKRLHEELGWPPYNRKVGELLLAVVQAAEESSEGANQCVICGERPVTHAADCALAALDEALV